jgi:hypothetical protein
VDAGGKIRNPAIFLGFRKNKKPTEVIPEKPIVEQTTKPGKQKTHYCKSEVAGYRR